MRYIELTPFDFQFVRRKRISYLYFFDASCNGGKEFSCLQPEVLRRSFAELVSLHPLLRWRVDSSPRLVDLQESNSAGGTEFVLPIMFVPTDEDFGVIRSANYVRSDLDELLPKREIDSTFEARVTYFRCGSVVVGVNACHAVFDGFAAYLLMCQWSALARGLSVKVSNADEERATLVQRIYVDAELPSDYQPSWWKPTELASTQPCALTSNEQCLGAPSSESVQVTVRVLLSALQRVKEGVAKRLSQSGDESAAAGVSQFTVLAALLWRATSRARVLSGRCTAKDSTVLRSVVDVRKRYGLPDDFMGNAIVNTASRGLNAEELVSQPLHESVAEVASSLRTASDASQVAKELLWISKWEDKAAFSSQRSSIVGSSLRETFFVNGQHRFSLKAIDFGGGAVPTMRCNVRRPGIVGDTLAVLLLPLDNGLNPDYVWMEGLLPAPVARLLGACVAAEGGDCEGLALEVFANGESIGGGCVPACSVA
jgi:hypothetical protein